MAQIVALSYLGSNTDHIHCTVKPVLSGYSKIDKKCLKDKWYLSERQKYCKVLRIQGKSIAEC